MDCRTLVDGKRRLMLVVICLGVLMIVLGTTVVNVALPSIQQDLKFTGTSLAWVVNAYMLTFGGFLLLGGRLADLFGHRRLFLAGIALFTVASLVCGLANTKGLLVAGRAVQGVGGAAVLAVALSLIMNAFKDRRERASAMGVYGFVTSAGGSVGLLVGGSLTSLVDWRWAFLINAPLGALVYAFCLPALPNTAADGHARRLDISGALTITVSLMIAVYAILGGNERGWMSNETIGLFITSLSLLALFLIIETRATAPLVPLAIFRLRNLSVSSVVGVLWMAGISAWFFALPLYMQLVLGYEPMQVALGFLPANVLTAACSLGLCARMIVHFGIKRPLVIGLLLSALGVSFSALAPVDAHFATDILPGMILVGVGLGIAFNALLLAAMTDVVAADTGLASGIVNSARMMGSAVGLAVLASVSAARTNTLVLSGSSGPVALSGGYQSALLVAALCVGFAAVVGALFIRADTGGALSGGDARRHGTG